MAKINGNTPWYHTGLAEVAQWESAALPRQMSRVRIPFSADLPILMSNSIQRDKKKRVLCSQYQATRIQLASVIHDLKLPRDVRYKSFQKLTRLPRNSSTTRVVNRCVVTGRGHSVYRLFGLSRLKFRELASAGLLMGVTKSSW